MTLSRFRVYMCVGPNCGPKGSATLIDVLQEELANLDLEETVSVLGGGCQSHCETGPTMVVFPGPFFYERVDAARLHRIAREHFAGGKPVSEFFWDRNRKPRKIIPGAAQGREISSGFDPIKTFSKNTDERSKPKPRKTYDVDDFKW